MPQIIDPLALVVRLCSLPRETEWLEFKENNFNANDTGKYVSALANSAMLAGEPYAYLVFGVRDGDHEIVGTSVRLKGEKVGAEPFENWLARGLSPRLNVDLAEFDYQGKHVEMIRIDPAYERPVSFNDHEYIRIGSITKSLREHPARARSLWAATSRFSFEQGVAAAHVSAEQISEEYDCREFFKLLNGNDRPVSQRAALDVLLSRQLVLDDKQGGYDVTNLFALLTARDLSKFPFLRAKAPRVVVYEGKDKLTGKSDQAGLRGYASAFQRVLQYVMNRLPQKEVMVHGVRVIEHALPEIAIRELLANAMIHQDLSQMSGPFIEMYSDRLTITNAGKPIVDLDRIIDTPSRSRNPLLAQLMRDLKLCEERGSGVDRAIAAVEDQRLPPPLFTAEDNSTAVTLYFERSFAYMTKPERLRGCYQHACLRQQANDFMSNGSLRKRFGMADGQYAQVSRLIAEAVDAGLIKPLDEDQGARNARYVPYWFQP